MATSSYQEAYCIVIDAHGLSKDAHDSLQEYINHFVEVTNGFTPYEAYIDPEYSDSVVPE
jgi:hypothetical protein